MLTQFNPSQHEYSFIQWSSEWQSVTKLFSISVTKLFSIVGSFLQLVLSIQWLKYNNPNNLSINTLSVYLPLIFEKKNFH